MRRILILMALLASGAILSAQERATFIKNDGQRISGLLESRTVSRGLFSRSSSFLLNVNNQQIQVPMSDVAVIDFAGGRPSTRELNSLPNDNSQLLVMRDGNWRGGRLVSFVNGDMVRWSYEPGDTEDVPMRQISRIYLNPSSARAALDNSQYGYNNAYGGNGNQYGQYGQYGQTYGGRTNGLLTPSNGLEVPANVGWTDTGIDVRAGDMLSFSANGEVQFGNDRSMRASPDGNGGMRSQSYPVPSMTVGALIGRVGRSAPFAIGGSRRAIQMPANGRLFLGVNDDAIGDNSGAFNVVIRGNGQVSSVPNGRANGYYRNRGAYGAGGLLTPSNGLQVPATTPWTDTGIDVQAGDMLSFSANGEIRWGTGGGDTANADGNSASMRNSYPLRGAPVGTLIGRVGNSAAFPVGTNTGAIRMPTSGRLFLGVNDDDRRDNSGAFNVVVRYAR